MSPADPGEVLEATVRVARAAFPKGSPAIRIRDELGAVFTDERFASLFPVRGRPAWSPGRLALVLVLQFAEGLSDRQAAQAVRGRIDWKYALGLELTDPGFDYSVLSEFRDRLVSADRGRSVLDGVLEAAAGAGLLKAGGRARTDSTHVLASVRSVNRLELVIETLRAALNALSAAAPHWVTEHAEQSWFDRYANRVEDYRLPQQLSKRMEMGHEVGADGMTLLERVLALQAPAWLRQVPAVETLRQVWIQQYHLVDGQVRWRQPKDCPPGALRLINPYDTEARTSRKRDTLWDGFKVHLTETCEPDAPHLVTHVVTTTATVTDQQVTDVIHQGLIDHGHTPEQHLVDTGYINARKIVAARRDHGIELVGPVKNDTTAQATAAAGYGQNDFHIDWDNEQVTCPNGTTTTSWRNARSQAGLPVIRVQFPTNDCRSCTARIECLGSSNRRYREITLRPRAEYEALHAARAAQHTPEWKQVYARRQGIEATISQGVRALGLRRTRYRGLGKTALQHHLTAAAINIVRLDAWITGAHRAPTRTSHLAALRPAG